LHGIVEPKIQMLKKQSESKRPGTRSQVGNFFSFLEIEDCELFNRIFLFSFYTGREKTRKGRKELLRIRRRPIPHPKNNTSFSGETGAARTSVRKKKKKKEVENTGEPRRRRTKVGQRVQLGANVFLADPRSEVFALKWKRERHIYQKTLSHIHIAPGSALWKPPTPRHTHTHTHTHSPQKSFVSRRVQWAQSVILMKFIPFTSEKAGSGNTEELRHFYAWWCFLFFF